PDAFYQVLRWLNRSQLILLIVCLFLLFTPLMTIRPAIWQQGMVSVMLIATGTYLLHLEESNSDRKNSDSFHLLLIILSFITTMRYFYYRVNYTMNLEDWLNGIFSILLFAAELYAILTLALAYFQTLRIKERKHVDLSLIPQEQWYKVDIYIPTYNEDVEIVRKTTVGAMAIDYPAEKKHVYILDDGRPEKYKPDDPRYEEFRQRREQLQQMCDELGCSMLTRDNNNHAKAGNINTAFRRTDGDLVLILDCDHIPSRQILQHTVGFFFNLKVALVQTPHWFYNPDPFERNLLTSGKIPVGNELFYKVLQKGNDFWNAAFFCGSAAVIRKEYVLQVGGIATETVTEDCHTSFRLHSLGYESIYYDKIMIAGLAPEKFSSYVGQQVRWARGMAQILRIENPLFNRKLNLTLAQRLCYFSATSHFFYGFPRLMYVVAPTMFLLFGINSVRGLGLETLFYALPHIVLSMQTNHVPYKHVRFSFWNEIYEFAMSFQAGMVTFLALVNPKLGSFNVTDKGLTVTKRSFDLDSVRYLVFLAALSGASLFMLPFWLLLQPEAREAVLINAMWSVFNLLLLLAACLVAFEQPQIRIAHRLPRELTAIIHSDNNSWTGTTINVSETGALILLDTWPNIPEEIKVELVGDFGARALLNAQVVRALATDKLQAKIAVHFINVTQIQKDDLTLVVYSDVQEWYSQKRAESDHFLRSFNFIATSLERAFRELRPEQGVKVRKQVRAVTELYWEGWDANPYIAKLTEIGVNDMRVELLVSPTFKMEIILISKPLISILVSQQMEDPSPQSLLAQIESIELLTSYPQQDSELKKIALELSFPENLNRQQKRKIKQLIRTLE
ncbi:MAG: UDP-forming cellulose synthase catalytic subunit, partial [Nostocaceae cyanobacterium]|nr:UDP-forming cellulose synthase catalytic subunit [Nostocaceae cyanobacterium]